MAEEASPSEWTSSNESRRSLGAGTGMVEEKLSCYTGGEHNCTRGRLGKHYSLHSEVSLIFILRHLNFISPSLSSADYQRELGSMSLGRLASSTTSVPSPAFTPATNQSSFFGNKLFGSSTAQPDPDQEDVVWHEPEAHSAVVSRKEHPRDHTSILSIREVLRNKSTIEGVSGLSSRTGSADGSKSRNASGLALPSARAKPVTEISKLAAGGEVGGLPESESAGKILQEIDTASTDSHTSSAADSESSKSRFGEAHIRRGGASSLVSDRSDSTIGPEKEVPPALPLKDDEPTTPGPAQSGSFFAVTNTITSAMRFMLSPNDHSQAFSQPFKNQHSLLNTDAFNIDERPHIKYDWMIGKRMKFSCTVYYAKQFDGLRRRCGIEDIFLKSLGRSTNWAAEGGKSKANFWKTSDDRFIIKTLVNAWNVADLYAYPFYFHDKRAIF